MSDTVVDTDVLIVGAGPVGLFLASECARRGLRWRLVEKRASLSGHSKALAIFPRTLEIFDMAGLAGPFLEVANRVDTIAVVTRDRPLALLRFAPDNSPYPFVAMVPQDVTEYLLAQSLARSGTGVIEYLTSFVSAAQHEHSVSVDVEHAGRRTTMRAAFVVGCDGAHSAVRQWLQLPFEGGEYDEHFMLADVATNDALPASQMQLCPDRDGPLAIFPMSATRRRIVAMIEDAQGDAPSLVLVRRLLHERAPAGIEANALHWSSYFRIHHRRVSRLRSGRVFVAGDAAHIHSPFGGQGMNTGLHDAWNLAWKLDLFVHGHGNEALLDSYSAERVPVIKGVIDTTHFLTLALGTPSRFAQALRDAVIPMVSRLAPFQHALVQRLSELGIAYHGSPIVEGAGERYLDDAMRGGTGIRSRFLLLIGSEADAPLVEAARQLAATHASVVELRPARRPGVTLVRPDGYVAFSGPRAHASAIESVRQLLGRQSGPA